MDALWRSGGALGCSGNVLGHWLGSSGMLWRHSEMLRNVLEAFSFAVRRTEALWEHPGDALGRAGAFRGCSGTLWGAPGTFWDIGWDALECHEGILRCSGTFRGRSGSLCDASRRSENAPGHSLDTFGLSEVTWECCGPLVGYSGTLWERSGALWRLGCGVGASTGTSQARHH